MSQGPTVIGHHLIPEKERHYPGDHLFLMEDRQYTTGGTELTQYIRHESHRQNRRPEVAHTMGIKMVKTLEEFFPAYLGSKTVFVSLPNHTPLLPRDSGYVGFWVPGDFLAKGDIEI